MMCSKRLWGQGYGERDMGMFHLFQRLSMFGELMVVLVSQGLHT